MNSNCIKSYSGEWLEPTPMFQFLNTNKFHDLRTLLPERHCNTDKRQGLKTLPCYEYTNVHADSSVAGKDMDACTSTS